MEELLKSPFFNLVSFCVGVLGILLATYFYFRTRRDVCCYYSVRSFNLIKDRRELLPQLKVAYRGEPIVSATVSKLLIVNSGDVAIKRADIAPTDPVNVHVSNGSILDISISAVNNPSSAVRAEIATPDTATISFEYLNPKDGAVIQIFHTASSNSDIRLTGKIIGLGEPKRVTAYSLAPKLARLLPFPLSEKRSRRLSRQAEQLRWPFLIATLIGTMGLLFLLVKAPELEIKSDKPSPLEFRWILGLAGTITLIPYWWVVFRLFRFSIPKGLEDFYDLSDKT